MEGRQDLISQKIADTNNAYLQAEIVNTENNCRKKCNGHFFKSNDIRAAGRAKSRAPLKRSVFGQSRNNDMVAKRKILRNILAGSKNIRFSDMIRLVEGFGFQLSFLANTRVGLAGREHRLDPLRHRATVHDPTPARRFRRSPRAGPVRRHVRDASARLPKRVRVSRGRRAPRAHPPTRRAATRLVSAECRIQSATFCTPQSAIDSVVPDAVPECPI